MKRSFRSISTLLCVSILMCLSSSCAHRVNADGTAAPASPYEQVLTVNAEIATVNNTVARGVIILQQQNLISLSQADRILLFQRKLTLDQDVLTRLLVGGQQAATGNAAGIQAAIATIKQDVQDALSSGILTVKNPVSQQNLSADIQSISTLADQLTTTLKTVGVLS